MKLGISLACLCLFLLSCKDSGNGPDAVDAGEFKADFKVGEKRLLLLEYAMQGKTYGFDLFNLAEIEIEKDTLFQGLTGKIVKSTLSQFLPESTIVNEYRKMLVRNGDSLFTYHFTGDGLPSPFLFGLVKRAGYDSSVFNDRTLDLVFPFAADKPWQIRTPDDTSGALPLEKEWIGNDTVAFDGKRFRCDVFLMHSFVPVKSWIASVGLLKAEIDYGTSYFTDSLGTVVDSAENTERYELLEINPSPSAIATAKEKYRAMTKEHMP
ncbi:MAG: hypothetical protein JWO30_4436 [Fibrobacteres bacterium]|nr:hypothetical protein [Fibrobacterota bacterium]